MKPKVLVTEPIHRVGWNLLTAEAEAVAWAGPQAEPLAQALEEAQGVIVRSARLPGEIIRGAKRLKIIAKHEAGVEKIDVAAATECGVVVTSTPAANAQSVAELALALLLSVSRRIGEYTRDLNLGKPRPRQTYAVSGQPGGAHQIRCAIGPDCGGNQGQRGKAARRARWAVRSASGRNVS